MAPRPPTEEEIAWMMAHADETLVPGIWACNIVCGIFSFVALLLRFWSRQIIHGRLKLESSDVLFVMGWLFYVLYLMGFISTSKYGGGRHVIFVTDAKMIQIWTIITEIGYYCSMGCIKLSILELYRSIFPSRSFHRAVWGVEAFVASWLVSGAVVSIFQCTPIDFGWDKVDLATGAPKPGFCVNYGLLVLIHGVFNIVIDFAILALPVPLVRKLHVSKHKRNLLIFTFALGGGACITSIVRLAFSLKVGSTFDGSCKSWAVFMLASLANATSNTGDNIAPGFVSTVELLVCLICASIPTYRPLYNRVVRKTFGTVNDSQNTKISAYKSYPSANRAKVTSDGTIVTTTPGIHVTDQVELMRYAETNGAWVRVADEDDRTLNTTRSR
jgi:hypothetical protein